MKKSLKNTKLRELRQVMKRYDKIRNVLAKIGKDEVTGSSPVSSSSRDVSLHPDPLSFMVADFFVAAHGYDTLHTKKHRPNSSDGVIFLSRITDLYTP